MTFLNQRARLFLHLAGFVLLLGAAFLPAPAQQITGSIVGTVKDQQGSVVTTAKVKATNVDTGFNRTAPANEYGEFRIDNLPIGKYAVQADATSFERYVQKNLSLDVGQTLSLDIKLVVGAQDVTITVEEAPPQVNTTDAVLGRTIEPGEVIGLPLVNRNAYTELSLTPGIMANSSSTTQNPSGTPIFRLDCRPKLSRSTARSTPATEPSHSIWTAATTLPVCATTATRLPTPTQSKRSAWTPTHSRPNTVNSPALSFR